MERDIIDDLARCLPVTRRRRHAISRELRSHLEETRRELELAGWGPEEAARESLSRLGDLDEIASEFARVYRPSRRTRIGLAFALAGTLLVGAYGASGTLASATSTHHPSPVHAHAAQHHCTRHR